jgi:uncharacterized membrane protein
LTDSKAPVAPPEQLARELLDCAYDELTPIQKSVIDLISDEAPTGFAPGLKLDDRTFGQRLADQVAAVGGSWAFIVIFMLFLVFWMSWNVLARTSGLRFDPYPFIFLNLMLSMLAALQAPVIMMSQNRASARDRAAAEHDYRVNLRAELEIMLLHDKLDALRERELVRLVKQQHEVVKLLRAQVRELQAETDVLEQAVKPARRGAKPAGAGRKRG